MVNLTFFNNILVFMPAVYGHPTMPHLTKSHFGPRDVENYEYETENDRERTTDIKALIIIIFYSFIFFTNSMLVCLQKRMFLKQHD